MVRRDQLFRQLQELVQKSRPAGSLLAESAPFYPSRLTRSEQLQLMCGGGALAIRMAGCERPALRFVLIAIADMVERRQQSIEERQLLLAQLSES